MKPTPSFSINNWRIAVLMGGPGGEREVSLSSGKAVANALRSLGAQVEEIDVKGTSFELSPDTALAFNMLHGKFGEDGGAQTLLAQMGIPCTGENAACSSLAFDKIRSKESFKANGVPTPAWEILKAGETPGMQVPFVVKPPREGSSLGIRIASTESEAREALQEAAKFDDEILVEKFISGRELTVGVLGCTPLPVIEIVPKGGVYDYKHKYTKGETEYFVPAPLSEEETAKIQAIAAQAHLALELQVYSRVDIILGQDAEIGVLEINTLPGMTETSLLPKAAAAAGTDFPNLCLRIAELSMKKYR
ncbi:MAG: D-alanine--D-alanine ligase [Chthoniobacterales bacterium]